MATTHVILLCIVAFVLGVAVGGVLAAICAASSIADAEIERQHRERRDE